MKLIFLTFLCAIVFAKTVYTQTLSNDYYDVKWTNGNGIRFNGGDDNCKIHLGAENTEFKYGPVTYGGIKFNMYNEPSLGWIWGSAGLPPVAALNASGSMQIKGDFVSEGAIRANGNLSSNGSLLLNGTLGEIPVKGAGARLMWVPSLAAFRVGMVTGTQWDSPGQYSAAFGANTIASGNGSFAIGGGTTASGISSIASGTSSLASGHSSAAFGNITKATGMYSVAMGSNTVAQSCNSVVIGTFNFNPGTYSTNKFVASDPLFVVGSGSSLTATSNAMMVLKNGNVIIGRNAPINSYKLDINGVIRANEIIVNTTGADFVFESDYKLIPLEVLEKKLKEEHHLPGVASAAEMQAAGVGLAELNTILLQKVEELTLYIIEQNKRIVRLENEQSK